MVIERNFCLILLKMFEININFPLKVKVTQSYLTLCNPMDGSLPGSSVHGILQARILEWVAILFSRGSSQPRDQTQVSCIAGTFYHLSHQESPIYHLPAK